MGGAVVRSPVTHYRWFQPAIDRVTQSSSSWWGAGCFTVCPDKDFLLSSNYDRTLILIIRCLCRQIFWGGKIELFLTIFFFSFLWSDNKERLCAVFANLSIFAWHCVLWLLQIMICWCFCRLCWREWVMVGGWCGRKVGGCGVEGGGHGSRFDSSILIILIRRWCSMMILIVMVMVISEELQKFWPDHSTGQRKGQHYRFGRFPAHF